MLAIKYFLEIVDEMLLLGKFHIPHFTSIHSILQKNVYMLKPYIMSRPIVEQI